MAAVGCRLTLTAAPLTLATTGAAAVPPRSPAICATPSALVPCAAVAKSLVAAMAAVPSPRAVRPAAWSVASRTALPTADGTGLAIRSYALSHRCLWGVRAWSVWFYVCRQGMGSGRSYSETVRSVMSRTEIRAISIVKVAAPVIAAECRHHTMNALLLTVTPAGTCTGGVRRCNS